MGGKSGGSPKMKVTRYYLSGHWGICQGPVDAIKAIWVGEKKVLKGSIVRNSRLGIAKEKLFGGMKKEGGVAGNLLVMLGGEDQIAPGALVSRLGRPANETPGFRGITSLFFYGTGGSSIMEGVPYPVFSSPPPRFYYNGFYWGTQAYLKPIWVTVQRIPARELSPLTAAIPRGSSTLPTSIYFELDDSGSMLGTRNTNMKAAMNLVLDQIAGQIDAGQRIDVGMSLFNGGKIERPRASLSDVNDLRNFVDAIPASGGTPFDAPIADAVSWFEASQNDPALANRINFFVTDGSPSGSSDDTAANLAAELLDRTIPVDMWGVNIDLQNTSATEKLHNMPEPVPIVSGDNSSELASIIKAAVIDIYDANPAHVIYECLTDTDWGMGASLSSIDTASFQSAAQTLYDESFGVFLQWQAQSSIEDFINNVLDHIKGALYPNPRTGQMTIRLLRDDLDIDNLKEITPDNAAIVNFSRKGWGETTNEIVVTWTRPETEKEETVRMQDLANIAQQGGVVSSSKNYHGIRTASLATRVAERDLREESAPLSSCEVEVNREFWDTVPYDGVKMTWPEYGLDGLVMRVMKVNYGDSSNSTIKLSLMEDVFSLSPASFVAPADGEWQDPGAPPAPVQTARLMPIPAYVASQAGVDLDTLEYPDTGIAPMPVNPTSDGSAHYDVLEEVATPSGGTELQEATGDRPFPGNATLVDELPPAVTSTGVTLADQFGVTPAVNEMLMLGDAELANDELELVLVTAVDSETGDLTLLRGALDTVPQRWAAGTTVTITDRAVWRPLPREYVDQQSVTLRFLTSTSSGMLEDYEAPEFTGTAAARPTKPTRPANLRAFDELFPDPDFYPTYPVTITWSHRNRLLEDAIILAWDEMSTPVESGVTYRVVTEAIQEDGSVDGVVADVTQAGTSYALAEAAIGSQYAGSPYIRVRVWASRDGRESWQAAAIRFRGPFREPTELSGAYKAPQPPTDMGVQLIP